jgi:hypothetical protein
MTPAIADRIPMERATELYLEHVDATYTGTDDRHSGRIATDLRSTSSTAGRASRRSPKESWEKAKAELHTSHGGPLGWRSIAHLANTMRGFLRWAHAQKMIASGARDREPADQGPEEPSASRAPR